MVKGGQTASATEFATLTGVTRERLRTWERRFGFPEPVRLGGGARRYAMDDVPRVVAIRRAIESGVPVKDAIAASSVGTGKGIADESRAQLAEVAPVPVVALSGPVPLRVEYVNAVIRQRPNAPAVGDDLLERAPWYAEHPGCETLKQLFAGDTMAAACEHPDWTGGLTQSAASIAYRLPYAEGGQPLVALIGIDTAAERRARADLQEARQANAALEAKLEEERRLAQAVAGVIDLFRHGQGVEALTGATAMLVRRLGIVDAAIASYMTGSLVLARSQRGLLGPEMVTVTRFDELSTALREDAITWLEPPTAAAFGTPTDLHTLAVPIFSSGEALGALMLVYDEQRAHTTAEEKLLAAAAGAIGFVLVRERVRDEIGQ